MALKKPIFDTARAKLTIEKGRRAKWWRRRGSMARGFFYVDEGDVRITDEARLERIKSLVIPPAWRHVRIAPTPGCRVQAVGMDTTGRIQYLYNAKFSERQQRKKFLRIEEFGIHLPRLRQITNEHILLEGFPREKVLAVMTRLINSLYFRVGTEKSAKHYRTYGITTLKNKHLEIRRNGELIFDFVGKSHVQHRKVLVDNELAVVMTEIKALGRAGKLFHYVGEDGKARPVRPSEINAYIKAATAEHYSAKDFRTWAGTLLAATELAQIGAAEDGATAKKNLVNAIRRVAAELGNTPAVCRGSYIHPTVLKAYEKGKTLEDFAPGHKHRIKKIQEGLEPEEIALLRLLAEA